VGGMDKRTKRLLVVVGCCIVGVVAVALAIIYTLHAYPKEQDHAALVGAVFAACTLVMVGFQVYLAWDENDMTSRQIEIMKNQDELLRQKARLWITSDTTTLPVPGLYGPDPNQVHHREPTALIQLYGYNWGERAIKEFRVILGIPPTYNLLSRGWNILPQQAHSASDERVQHYTWLQKDFDIKVYSLDGKALDLVELRGNMETGNPGEGLADPIVMYSMQKQHPVIWRVIHDDGQTPVTPHTHQIMNSNYNDRDLKGVIRL
jgi:hypothetical protein